MKPVTFAHVRIHGVRQLIVYCRGKRDGDWPCHHEATLPIERFHAADTIGDIERRCRCTNCGWRKADVRPDYNKPLPPRTSVGWIMLQQGLLATREEAMADFKARWLR